MWWCAAASRVGGDAQANEVCPLFICQFCVWVMQAIVHGLHPGSVAMHEGSLDGQGTLFQSLAQRRRGRQRCVQSTKQLAETMHLLFVGWGHVVCHLTDRRATAGTAPADVQFTKTRVAVPVHQSPWLSGWLGRREFRSIIAGRERFDRGCISLCAGDRTGEGGRDELLRREVAVLLNVMRDHLRRVKDRVPCRDAERS